jgi:hypothetical protein
MLLRAHLRHSSSLARQTLNREPQRPQVRHLSKIAELRPLTLRLDWPPPALQALSRYSVWILRIILSVPKNECLDMSTV